MTLSGLKIGKYGILVPEGHVGFLVSAGLEGSERLLRVPKPRV